MTLFLVLLSFVLGTVFGGFVMIYFIMFLFKIKEEHQDQLAQQRAEIERLRSGRPSRRRVATPARTTWH